MAKATEKPEGVEKHLIINGLQKKNWILLLLYSIVSRVSINKTLTGKPIGPGSPFEPFSP